MKNKLTAALLLCLLCVLSPRALAAESPVRIAVIDTGIATAAIDPTNIVEGVNYILPDQDTEDRMGHGTAVAAILVGSASANIEGVCPTAQLVPLVWQDKDADGQTVAGTCDTAAKAIYDAIDRYACNIINLSAGALIDSAALRAAVAYAEEEGVLVVSAAGNDGTDALYYPGAYDTVLCVGASNTDGTAAASFSNHSGVVDVLASGQHLKVASIRGKSNHVSGTSYAVAYATGAAAALLTEDPSLTPAQLRRILRASATDIGETGYDDESGWGVLNLEMALQWLREGRSFRDVEANEAVTWAVSAFITDGINAVEFSPDSSCTRAQVMTFLWRAAGCPMPVGQGSGFNDVSPGAWYAAAVTWAVEQGITTGTSATTFSPNAPCTEGQVLTFLRRALEQENQTQTVTEWARVQKIVDSVNTNQATTRLHVVSYLYTVRENIAAG